MKKYSFFLFTGEENNPTVILLKCTFDSDSFEMATEFANDVFSSWGKRNLASSDGLPVLMSKLSFE